MPQMRRLPHAGWLSENQSFRAADPPSANGLTNMTTPANLPESSLRTIASYEAYALTYARSVAQVPGPEDERALRLFSAAVGSHGTVLEIGSGPGWDADFVESLGPRVRRTDATRSFLEFMRQRGRSATRLNVLTDSLGGPYEGIMALCVLIHIAREQTADVLEKIFDALLPGGAFLVSVREGSGESHGDYLMTYWSRTGFGSRLTQAGFAVQWNQSHVAVDGERWATFLARRPL